MYLCVCVCVCTRVCCLLFTLYFEIQLCYRYQKIFPLTSILQYKYTKYLFTLLLTTFGEVHLLREVSILTSWSSLGSWLALPWISYVNFRPVGSFASSSAEFCYLHVHPIFQGCLQQWQQLRWQACTQPWAPAQAARFQQHRHQGCRHPLLFFSSIRGSLISFL